MRLLKKSKRIISAGLSVIMLSSMMAGLTGEDVYASPASSGQVVFDIGEGPKFQKGDGSENTTNGYGSAAMNATFSANKYTIAGGVSATLDAHAAFAGIPRQNVGSGNRPQLPTYADDAWPGFTLNGWYDEDDQKYEYLPYAFQGTGTYLKAKWVGSATNRQSMFRVRHYIEKPGQTIALTDVLNHDSDRIVPLKYNSWAHDVFNTQTAANTQISSTPATDIPGYKVSSAAISDGWNKKADGTTNYGTQPAAKLDNSSKKVSGLMPNHDLTVDYKYSVDTSRNFTVRIQYLNALDGTPLKAEDTVSVNAGADASFSSIPQRINTLYVLQKDTMANMLDISGIQATNLATAGQMSLQFMNGEAEGTDMRKAPYFNATNGNFSFKMPNHNITLKYKYNMDTSVTRPVVVQYLDNHGVAIPNLVSDATAASGEKQVPTTYDLALPKLSGYLYPPNVNVEPASTDFETQRVVSASDPHDPALRKFQYKITATEPSGGRKIKVNYSENLADKEFWTKVSFEKVGVSEASYTPPAAASWKKDPRNADNTPANNTLATVLGTAGNPATALPPAGTDYVFDSVYVKNNPSIKYENLTDVVNLKAVANGGIADANGNVTLVIKFKKDPTKWARVEFKAGPGGSLPGTRNFPSKNINDNLADFAPTPTPRANYQFDGWFLADADSNPVTRMTTENPMIPGSGNFAPTTKVSTTDVASDGSAKFIYVALFKGVDPRPGVYVAPALEASIGDNGLGTITVNGASDRRRYILTDLTGNILDNKSGSALGTGKFANLPIGRKYNAYEVEDTDTTATGNISAVVVKSAPAEVLVPVAAGRITFSNGTEAGTKKVTLTAPAVGTEYALVNSSTGEVVLPVSPGVFDNLTPNTNFVLVARPTGDTTAFNAPHVLESGTPVYTPATSSRTAANYRLTLVGNGAQITSVTRGGNPVPDFVAGSTSFDKLQRGDRVSISAPAQNSPQLWAFDKWIVNIGTLSAFSAVQNTSQFTMPANDIMLSTTYRYDAAIPGAQVPDLLGHNSALSYIPMNGKFSIDPAEAEMYKSSIVHSGTSDDTYITSGRIGTTHESSKKVTYTVRFNQRSPLSTEISAIRAVSTDPDHVRFAFAVDVSLIRKFNTTTVDLDGSIAIPQMRIYAKLDDSNRGGYDYKLYKIVGGVVTEVAPDVDLDTLDTESFGINGVQPNAGESYVLAYKRKSTVRIEDTKIYLAVTDPNRTTTSEITVPEGSSLEDVADYTALGFDPDAEITGADNGKYKFVGLYKEPGFTNAFSAAATVREDMILYTKYEQVRDEARENAREALEERLARVEELLRDPSLPASARGTLASARATANAALNRTNPVASAADLNSIREGVVEPAITTANEALTVGTSRTELRNAINDANTLLADTNRPVSPQDRQDIESARDAAALLLTDPNATQSQIEAMRQQLNDAVDRADARATKVSELNRSIEELERLSANPRLSSDDKAVVDAKIAEAKALRDQTSPQASINELVAKKSELDEMIRAVNARLSGGGGGGGSRGGGGGGGSRGGGGGGGSTSGGGGPKLNSIDPLELKYSTYKNGIDGHWVKNEQNNKWSFIVEATKQPVKDTWANVIYGSGVDRVFRTYAFDAEGYMKTGWIQDAQGIWYYMTEVEGAAYGALLRGWYSANGKWYYLSPVTGAMMTGWQEIEKEWYLLAADGVLYVNTRTPDGFPVDANGVWMRETP